jgi:4-diphosphocytidyl-2-C-methyl-D-erythritol kinase
MIVFPIAKINIGLRITGKRQDGFHNIETIFYPIRLSDALEFVVSDQFTNKDILKVTGIDPGSKPVDNLVMKSIIRLREKKPFPFLQIHLHKAIPVGAGLGGGSSDAACLLNAINKHFDLKFDKNDLRSIALEIGSDCPFFVDGIPSFASGRGEILTAVNKSLSGLYLVLADPGSGINTAEAYRNCKPEKPSVSLHDLFKLPLSDWKKFILNDFEAFAFKKHPLIGELKDELYNSGALFSLMSGSGSSVYGIFSEKPGLSTKLKEYVIWEGDCDSP